MKKSTIKSLAATAICTAVCTVATSPARAQSSVTLFGVVDLAVSRLQADGLGHKTGLSTGNQAASRLGFRGTEDLGGGLAAGFWIEGALQPDEGNAGGLLFQRRSTVSLLGAFGELRLGRDFAPSYLNITYFDPFGARGIGTTIATGNFGYSDLRNSNQVHYFTPATLGGFFGSVAYSWGGTGGVEPQSNQANSRQGDYWGGRVGYAAGPVSLAAGIGQWKQVLGASNTAPVAIGHDLKEINAGATWDFGVAKLWGFYGQERAEGNPVGNNRLDSTLLGVTAPLGAGEIRASIAHYDMRDSANDSNKFAIGYGYNLSKRTQLYATVATVRNQGTGTRVVKDSEGLALTGGARPGGRSSGFDIGIRHSF
ncbi:MAG: porin [Pseudomonadota bacterium]